MKHIFEQKVYYADTDAYGVAWHGTYLRWMEAGRVELIEKIGYDLVELKKNNVVMPVTRINLRFKSSAKLGDTVVIETCISEVSPVRATFRQVIKNKETGRVYVNAEVEGVAVNNEGKIYRNMPANIKEAFEKAMET